MEINWERTNYEVEEWFHQDPTKTVGLMQHEGLPQYTIAITAHNPLEPELYYVSITVEKLIELSNKIYTFKGRTKSTYKFNLPKDKTPMANFIFLFVEKAAYDFAVEYTQRVAGTLLQFHKIPVPQFETMKKEIQDGIDVWDKDIRYVSLQ